MYTYIYIYKYLYIVWSESSPYIDGLGPKYIQFGHRDP